MMKRTLLFRGLSAMCAILLIITTCGTRIALDNEGGINDLLGTVSSKTVTDSSDDMDTEYYKSEFGERNAENLTALKTALVEHGVTEMEEGAVLLKNDNHALPLTSSERSVTLFGRHSTVNPDRGDGVGGSYGTTEFAGPLYRGSSAGNTNGNEEHFVSYLESLSNAGFDYNQELIDIYYNQDTRQKGGARDPFAVRVGEAPVSIYSDAVKETWRGGQYNDAAIIILVRDGGEDSELLPSLGETAGADQGKSQLSLMENEKALLQMVKEEKDAGYFDKVIVIINSSWAMEVGWFEDYGVDAALLVGGAGDVGFTGVANILTGKANPSGKVTDTYAVSSLSSPALVNGSYNAPQWVNKDEYTYGATVTGGKNILDAEVNTSYYNVQIEGIYVGYKYYETRYEDTILNQGGASSNVGATAEGATSWKWEDEVTYPFGYGLSYTTFEQTLDKVDVSSDTIVATVAVKNTGSMAGKSVVELYAQTPYGDYEKENYVEKSSIQLVGFGKTGELAPGQTEVVTIEVDKYLLSSYDSVGAKGYILSQGNYYLTLGDDAHDALNNILACKGAENLVGIGGTSVSGNKDKVYSWKLDSIDTTSYQQLPIVAESEVEANSYAIELGAVVTNQFDDCDINYWEGATESPVRYLTRSDWKNTYPTDPVQVTLTEDMAEVLNSDFYQRSTDAKNVSDYNFGAKNGLTFVMMKDVPYDDDETWGRYLDQFKSVEELAMQTGGLMAYVSADSVGKPEYAAGDGPDGGLYGTAYDANGNELGGLNFCFTNEVVLGATWNSELMTRRGELIGEIGIYTNKPASFAPGGNIHRTPFSGRNHEYFSEDANLCYYGNMYFCIGMNSKGVLSGIKHVTANDQEARREGLSTFFTEQNLREGALRAEEGALRVGNAKMLMQSFNRLGLTFSSVSKALVTTVLEEEWGFRGLQETDAVGATGYKAHWASMIAAGTDTFCFDGSHNGAASLTQNITENNDGDLLEMLRQSVKDTHYALSRSSLTNGLNPNSVIVSVTPWWKAALIAADVTLGVLCAATFVLFVARERKILKQRRDEA